MYFASRLFNSILHYILLSSFRANIYIHIHIYKPTQEEEEEEEEEEEHSSILLLKHHYKNI